MKSTGARSRTIYVLVIMIVIGLSIIHSSAFTEVYRSTSKVYAKYTNTFDQAASLVNNCSGDGLSSIICVNDNPQTQGENNIVNTPINSHISNPAKPGSATEAPTGIINVVIEIVCQPGNQPQTCERLDFPIPSDFTAQVLAGNPTEPFLGSIEVTNVLDQPVPGQPVGTKVAVETGSYEVILLFVPIIEDAIYTTTFSQDCIGSIKSGETKFCTIQITIEGGSGGSREVDTRPHLTILS
jgi:hypothetical protein